MDARERYFAIEVEKIHQPTLPDSGGTHSIRLTDLSITTLLQYLQIRLKGYQRCVQALSEPEGTEEINMMVTRDVKQLLDDWSNETLSGDLREHFKPAMTSFSKLPAQVRNMIWDLMLPGPRVIQIRLVTSNWKISAATPAVLQINKESRAYAQKQYDLLFSPWSETNAYFSKKLDICYLHTPQLDKRQLCDYENISEVREYGLYHLASCYDSVISMSTAIDLRYLQDRPAGEIDLQDAVSFWVGLLWYTQLERVIFIRNGVPNFEELQEMSDSVEIPIFAGGHGWRQFLSDIQKQWEIKNGKVMGTKQLPSLLLANLKTR